MNEISINVNIAILIIIYMGAIVVGGKTKDMWDILCIRITPVIIIICLLMAIVKGT